MDTTSDNILEKTPIDDTFKNNKEIVESACKRLIQQLSKTCPNINLSSITIKTTASPLVKVASNEASKSEAAKNILLSNELTKTSTIQLKPLTSDACMNEKKNAVNQRIDNKTFSSEKKHSRPNILVASIGNK